MGKIFLKKNIPSGLPSESAWAEADVPEGATWQEPALKSTFEVEDTGDDDDDGDDDADDEDNERDASKEQEEVKRITTMARREGALWWRHCIQEQEQEQEQEGKNKNKKACYDDDIAYKTKIMIDFLSMKRNKTKMMSPSISCPNLQICHLYRLRRYFRSLLSRQHDTVWTAVTVGRSVYQSVSFAPLFRGINGSFCNMY